MGDKMESTWLSKQPKVNHNLPKIVTKSSAAGGFRRFGSVWGDLGASLSILGASWERLGASWGHLGAVLGASLPVFGRLGGALGRLEASRGRLGASGARFSKDSIQDTILYPICNRFCLDFATVGTRGKASW